MRLAQEIGHRLRKSREQIGLTQEQAAKAIGISREYLSMLETVRRRAPLRLLEKLSENYACPVSWFYGAGEPTETFQLLLRRSRSLSAVGRKDLVRFCHICNEIVTLRRILDKEKPEFPLYGRHLRRGERLAHLAREIATSERSRLGLEADPVPNLTPLLEAQGIAIVRLPLSGDQLSGAMAYDCEKGGFILVNASEVPSRQLWTVAHEYAHLLRDREKGYTLDTSITENWKDGSSRDDKAFGEYFANRFAAHFLMPEETVRRLIDFVWDGRIDQWTLMELRRMLGVSYHALLIRLMEMNYLRDEQFRGWKELPLLALELRVFGKSEEQISPSPSGLLWELSLEAAFEGEITASRCGELLGISPMEVADLLSAWEAGSGCVGVGCCCSAWLGSSH